MHICRTTPLPAWHQWYYDSKPASCTNYTKIIEDRIPEYCLWVMNAAITVSSGKKCRQTKSVLRQEVSLNRKWLQTRKSYDRIQAYPSKRNGQGCSKPDCNYQVRICLVLQHFFRVCCFKLLSSMLYSEEIKQNKVLSQLIQSRCLCLQAALAQTPQLHTHWSAHSNPG